MLTKLVSITLVLVTVTSTSVDQNTNYNSSRDYLLMICLLTALVVLFGCSAHLRHRKRLPAGRAAFEFRCGEVATAWSPGRAPSSGMAVAIETRGSSMIRPSVVPQRAGAGVTPKRG
jgi:hypothetical protein